MSPEPKRGEAASQARRYSRFVGLAFLALVGVATLNTINTSGGGLLGASPSDRGTPLPEFAVPAARGPLDGDANVYQDDCATSQNPCPAGSRRAAACEIPPRGAIRICDLFDRPLAISWLFSRGAECVAAQDAVARAARRYRGRVNFLIVDVRDDRDQVRQLVAEHHWHVPVGYDADGAASDLYRVGVCPTVQYAYPGGIFQGADFGDQVTFAGVRDHLEALLRQSRARDRRAVG
jgi:hypothetical protein